MKSEKGDDMEKEFEKLQKSLQQIEKGEVVEKTLDELRKMEKEKEEHR